MGRAALIAIALFAAAPPAAADTIEGRDVAAIAGTASIFGKNSALSERRDARWTSRDGTLTLGKIVDEKIDGGDTTDLSADTRSQRTQIERGLRFEHALIAAITHLTFTQDVPVALPDDALRALAADQITATHAVITWTGTAHGVAHYRVWSTFALGGVGLTGAAAVAGTLDLDAARGALVDTRVSAIVTTSGLARIDVRGSAHLTRRYR